MPLTILYWHWLMAGMLLIIAEMFIPRLAIFKFPVGALLVAVFLVMLPELALSRQLLIFASAACFFFFWVKLIRQRMTGRTKTGIPQELLPNASGLVIKAPADEDKGIVHFPIPVLEMNEWPFVCEQAVQPGDRVEIDREMTLAIVMMQSKAYEDLSHKAVKNKKIDSRLRNHGATPKDDALDIPELTLIVTKTD